MERIVGLVFSGFMVKLYATGMALLIAIEACSFIVETFGKIGEVL